MEEEGNNYIYEAEDIGYIIAALTPVIGLICGLVLLWVGATGDLDDKGRDALLTGGNGLILGGGFGTGLAQRKK